MKTSTIIWIIVIIVIIVGGWYWYSMRPSMSNAPATTTTGTNPAPAASQGDGTSVSQNLALGLMSNTSIGQYLTAYDGMTVYTYDKDTSGVSNCSGQCALNWPPYTVPAGSALNLQAGVTGQIATITRADGTSQVTYNGMPLYFYAGDKTGSDVNGNGVGGVWHVVKP